MRSNCAGLVVCGWLLQVAAAQPAAAGSIGLAISEWRIAAPEVLNQQAECPEGLAIEDDEQLKAQIPDAQARQAWFRRYGIPFNRGRNGEDVTVFPESVQDPFPHRIVRDAIVDGFDLDGGLWGKGRARPLPHAEFVSPAGEKGIDNQLFRAVGCVRFLRDSGFTDKISSLQLPRLRNARVLIRVDGVEDEANDPDVIVTIMKGADPLATTDAGKFIPYITQRIDSELPQYTFQTRGRIIDGTLITEPVDKVTLPVNAGSAIMVRVMHDLRLKLKLGADGASGLVGGYEDLHQLWQLHRTLASAPAYWAALNSLADGYPDPGTGKPTAISAAYRINAVRVLIVDAAEVPDNKPVDIARLVKARTGIFAEAR